MTSVSTAKMSVTELTRWVRSLAESEIRDACLALKKDSRRAAASLILWLEKRIAEAEEERERLNRLFRYENEIWGKGITHIAGVDEAGRGPLAGPVVAAAVILRPGTYLTGLNDSKQVSAHERERLYELIRERAVAHAVGIRDARYIEQHNIARASFRSMRDALLALSVNPEFVLVDGFRIPDLTIPQKHIIKGDALSNSIAAASIVAKVTRDRLMDEMARLYPAYGFSQNKGYSTREHLEALHRYGLCEEHRRTFISVARAQLRLDSAIDG